LADRIRVLFAIGEMSGGGSQRQLIGILQRLNRTRFEPQLYLVSPGGELLAEVPADVPVHVFAERCKQRRWFFPGQAHRARVRDLADVLTEQSIDLIYDRTYHMTLIAAGAVRRRPTKRVSVIVTDPQRDFATNPERFRAVKRLLLKRAYHSADRVAAVSEGVRRAAIEHYHLPPEKTLTLYNSFDIERIDRLMEERLPPGETHRGSDWFEIVAAGRLHPQKGFVYLLDAIRELIHERGRSNIHLRILGTGQQEPALRQKIDTCRVQSNVTLAGFRPNPLPYYRQADLFCLSSLYEGMPNALVEAMFCRVPVLATDCPSGPREVLDNGRLGRLVPSADSHALAAAIEDAAINRDQWRSLTASARSYIADKFAPRTSMELLEELFASLVQK
jgi:glycosyltransferase involved in cell wall biosynthesis